MFELETNRLRLRQLRLTDSGFILELVNDPQWLAFIGDKHVHSIGDAESYLKQGPLLMYEQRGFGLYAVEHKETATPIGLCGLIKRDSLENVDLGFAFLPAHRGTGFAQEAAEVTLRYANQTLKLAQVDAITLPGNQKSIALLERLNFTYSHLLEDGDDSVALYTNVLAQGAPD